MNNLKNIMIFLLLNLCYGCSFVDIELPTDRITTATIFEKEQTATAAVLGMYGSLVSTTAPFSNGATTIYTGLASDELITNSTLDNYLQFYHNKLAIDNSIVATSFWRNAYEIIYQANTCIEGLNTSTAFGATTKSQLLGEAYFIRSFCYFYLVNLFGDVPLVLNSNYKENDKLARTSSDLVNKQILSDLTNARNLLLKEYPSDGRLRVNYYTALALLSRYYLYEQNWQKVLDLTTEILNSGKYSIEPMCKNVFLSASKEAIWQLASDQTRFNTVEGSRFIPSVLPNFKPNFIISESLFNAFESTDIRKSEWIAAKTVLGISYKYPFKYKISQNTVKTEHYVIFRLSEIYLNRAEALAHLGNTSQALADINILRARAGLNEKTIQNTQDVLTAILSERRIELFAEWGHRWFDLRRTGTINDVLGKIKPDWNHNAQWFPIPAVEIASNPNLVQNPGYNN